MDVKLFPRNHTHRSLKSCVCTRHGYAAFGVQLRKAYFVSTWYAIRIIAIYVRLCTHMLYAGDHVSSRLVLVIWVCMIWNNPGLQMPMTFPQNRPLSLLTHHTYYPEHVHMVNSLCKHIAIVKIWLKIVLRNVLSNFTDTYSHLMTLQACFPFDYMPYNFATLSIYDPNDSQFTKPHDHSPGPERLLVTRWDLPLECKDR